MTNSKRICHTCGSEYEYCPGCARSAGKPEWMLIWCSDECKDVFEALSAYNLQVGTAEDVKDALQKHEVVGYEKYIPRIRKQLQKIVPAAELKQPKIVDIDSRREKV